MISEAEIEAALVWADHVAAGKAESYDPYIVALAELVREQREEISRLTLALAAVSLSFDKGGR